MIVERELADGGKRLDRHPFRRERRQGARDALALIEVEYEPLPAVVNARKALDPDAPVIRDDKEGQTDNLASPLWEAGD